MKNLPAAQVLRVACAMSICMLAACTRLQEPPTPLPEPAVSDWLDDYAELAAEPGNLRFRVDPETSLVVVQVFRAGRLARLGHDHVIASHALSGYVLMNPARGQCRGNFALAVAELSVDEPDLRERYEFRTQPSETDIQGTRANMLEHVLDAEHYPQIAAFITACDINNGDADLRINLRNAEQPLRLKAQRFEFTNAGFEMSGHFTLRQSDFGITPFSVMGGLLSVADAVEIHYRINGRKLE